MGLYRRSTYKDALSYVLGTKLIMLNFVVDHSHLSSTNPSVDTSIIIFSQYFPGNAKNA